MMYIPIYRYTTHPKRLLLEEKLSAKPTDEVCGKSLHFSENLGEIATFSTSSAPSGHYI